jgi:hypothetical protein
MNKVRQIKVDPNTGITYESVPSNDKALMARLKNFNVKWLHLT